MTLWRLSQPLLRVIIICPNNFPIDIRYKHSFTVDSYDQILNVYLCCARACIICFIYLACDNVFDSMKMRTTLENENKYSFQVTMKPLTLQTVSIYGQLHCSYRIYPLEYWHRFILTSFVTHMHTWVAAMHKMNLGVFYPSYHSKRIVIHIIFSLCLLHQINTVSPVTQRMVMAFDGCLQRHYIPRLHSPLFGNINYDILSFKLAKACDVSLDAILGRLVKGFKCD